MHRFCVHTPRISDRKMETLHVLSNGSEDASDRLSSKPTTIRTVPMESNRTATEFYRPEGAKVLVESQGAEYVVRLVNHRGPRFRSAFESSPERPQPQPQRRRRREHSAERPDPSPQRRQRQLDHSSERPTRVRQGQDPRRPLSPRSTREMTDRVYRQPLTAGYDSEPDETSTWQALDSGLSRRHLEQASRRRGRSVSGSRSQDTGTRPRI